jgi:hypothetical protein
VIENLNIQRRKSLSCDFGADVGSKIIWNRFSVHDNSQAWEPAKSGRNRNRPVVAPVPLGSGESLISRRPTAKPALGTDS